MSDPDLPIALRPVGNYPARQASIFEDPGDEKSWHRSQRSESLLRFYVGREPSWYASAIRPLAGAKRVLDLGCGPGLTLDALSEQGAESVLGIDRWPGFAKARSGEGPIVLHDLTLPMPFLTSDSFDGILSHYALDYVSPIGMRQVLREARRLLAPGGTLLIYVAAIGLGGDDETRTTPCSEATMRLLMEEAGFSEPAVESSPNGRNTIVSATRDTSIAPRAPKAIATVAGEVQLSAAFAEAPGERLRLFVSDESHRVSLEIGLEDERGGGPVSIAARLVSLPDHGFELQAWAWSGRKLAAAETLRLEFSPTELRVDAGSSPEFVDSWAPAALAVETVGSAYDSEVDLGPADETDETRRGAEGRRIIVESERLNDGALARLIGTGANRFLVRRFAAGMTIAELDTDWLAGRALGVVVRAGLLGEPDGLAPCLWADARQALLLLEGGSWSELAAAAAARTSDSIAPMLLVDPALTGGRLEEVAEAALELVAAETSVFLILDPRTRQDSAAALERCRGKLLDAREQGGIEAAEALRYLTERTLLMRLRHESGRPLGDLGRRPSLS